MKKYIAVLALIAVSASARISKIVEVKDIDRVYLLRLRTEAERLEKAYEQAYLTLYRAEDSTKISNGLEERADCKISPEGKLLGEKLESKLREIDSAANFWSGKYTGPCPRVKYTDDYKYITEEK